MNFLLLVCVAIGGGPFWPPISDDLELQSAIGKIEKIRNGKLTDFQKLGMVANELVESFPEADRQGVLLFHLLNVYAQSGMQHRPEMLAIAKRADAILREPIRRAALHTLTGDACRLGVDGPPDPLARRDAAKWYLHGLQEIMAIDPGPELPEKEIMSFFNTGDEAVDRQLHEAQTKQFHAREFQRMIRLHSEVLRNQTVDLYKNHPGERNSLATVCSEVFGDDAFCESLLAEIPKPSIKPLIEEKIKDADPGKRSRYFWILALNLLFLGTAFVFVRKRKTSPANPPKE